MTPTLGIAKMSSADKYKKHTHREHILELPDTYIGSVETHEESRWVFNADTSKMGYHKVQFNPGFYKLFDEILVNARDALVRSVVEKDKTPVKHIDISVKRDDKGLVITVENDGDGIPIEEHPTEKVYVPEMIFGHLLTSGNYNKEEEKIVGGKNGYGAKLTNIFSHEFSIETRSPRHGMKYSQTWKDHMLKCSKPSLHKDKGVKGFVKITYTPDLSRFIGLDIDSMLAVLHTRAIEISALAGKEVKVSWNGETITTNTFEKYVKLFVKDEAALAYERCSDRWEVAAVLTRTLFDDEDDASDEKHVSFVNGINTKKGGKHVETVSKHILGDFCEVAKKKRKIDIKPAQLKDSLMLFVNATIVNPAFDSQTKETLTTPASKFGSPFKTSGKLVEGLVKLGLLDEAQSILDAKANRDAKKSDGKKRTTLRGMPKLVDALWAGTAKSGECTLILTEGDSAATSAISGLKVVGREKWGVFPLKGKILNVRDVSADKFSKNEELTAIKKIIGLEHGKKYTDLKSLRYGRIMVMADQDLDGSHIKGLLMNLFHAEWPTLLQAGFVCSLATPLLKASRRGEVLSFYSQGEFNTWRESLGDSGLRGWTLKYYKGLGTSTPAEAQEWFQNLHEIKYTWDDETNESISLAFSKKRADDRKKWLATYDPSRILNAAQGNVDFTKFIHDELIHFSNADNIRSLPHIMDGLKPSQRKILFACLKRNLSQEIRVAQLAGYVSEHAAYHHGEASLNMAIVSMAQVFVGANNINLLAPVGQFGSRLMGGKDSASPRYIHTHLESIVSKIYRKEDNQILNYIDDDGLQVEPDTYLPVLPMLLVNGCVGIGTGFSTDIPPYNPSDLVSLLRDRLTGKRTTLQNLALQPWWLGFRGRLTNLEDGGWQTRGLYTFDDAKKIVSITELPVGTWTNDYKAFLDEMCTNTDVDWAKTESGKPILKNYEDLYNHIDVRFDLQLDPDYYDDAKDNPAEFEKRFRLTSTWRTSNMVCFNNDMKIIRYNCVGDILEDFYKLRVAKYEERRTKEIERLRKEAIECDAKARFLRANLEGTIDLRRKTDDEIVMSMKEHKLPALSTPFNEELVDSYEYLLRLRIDRVKASAIDEAERQVALAKEAVEELEQTTASTLWTHDLDEFEGAWEPFRKEHEDMLFHGGAPQKTKKKIRIVKKD
jgi:DNA topoisomerase-2